MSSFVALLLSGLGEGEDFHVPVIHIAKALLNFSDIYNPWKPFSDGFQTHGSNLHRKAH